MTKESRKFIYLFGVILVFFLFFTFKSYFPNEQISESHELMGDFPPILTGSTEDGDVAIELKPIVVSKRVIKLEISANTHSVDLSPFDLKKMITLTSNGKEYNPVVVPQLGGHHASGELVFEGDFKSEKFAVIIKDIPLIKERGFSW